MKIRLARLDDLDAIYQIELANFGPDEAISYNNLRTHIEKIPTTFLVAEDDKLLAYLEGPVVKERHLQDISFSEKLEDFSDQEGGYISITSLSVAKEAQGSGIGRYLLEVMKDIARRDNRQGINLTCHDYLVSYYEKHAFVQEGLSHSKYFKGVWYDMVWENTEYDANRK